MKVILFVLFAFLVGTAIGSATDEILGGIITVVLIAIYIAVTSSNNKPTKNRPNGMSTC